MHIRRDWVVTFDQEQISKAKGPSPTERSAAEELSNSIHYVELATDRTSVARRLFAMSQRFPAGEHAH